jgi:hypothetical protein
MKAGRGQSKVNLCLVRTPQFLLHNPICGDLKRTIYEII